MDQKSTQFARELDAWDGKPYKTFEVGTTSEPLKSIGIKDRKIIWHSSKISTILHEHKNMTRDIIKQVPTLLEKPVFVLKSQNIGSRLVILGEVYDANGAPITAILELLPTGRGGNLIDYNVIASAYAKNSNLLGFLKNSEVLYVDPDKKRTVDWLDGLGLQLPSYADNHGSVEGAGSWFQSVGLQLPSGKTNYGPIGQITYTANGVNIQGRKLPFTTYNIPPATLAVNSNHEISENNSPTAPKRAENEVFMPSAPSDRDVKQENPQIRSQRGKFGDPGELPVDREAFDGLIERLKQTGLAKDVITDSNKMREYLAKHSSYADRFMSLWHGSPHSFDKFSTDYMGTGEGAQAYGWGLYFTEVKSIAQTYAMRNSWDPEDYHTRYYKLDGKLVNDYDTNGSPAFWSANFLFRHRGDTELAKMGLMHRMIAPEKELINHPDYERFRNDHDIIFSDYKKDENYKSYNSYVRDAGIEDDYDVWEKLEKYVKAIERIEEYEEAIALIDSGRIEYIPPSAKALYNVKVHGDKTVDELNFMRWDKPLTDEQQKGIRQSLENLKTDGTDLKTLRYGNELDWFIKNVGQAGENNGGSVYNYLQDMFHTPQAASKFLLSIGVDGIKYPDSYLSKGSHEDAFNYVVFDDTVIDIVEKNLLLTRTPAGELYGFVTADGTIFLDPQKMNANTPIHEFGHLWVDYIKGSNPALYERLREAVQDSDILKNLRNSDAYRSLDDVRLEEEAMAFAIGNKGERMFSDLSDPTKPASTVNNPTVPMEPTAVVTTSKIERLKGVLNDVWNWIGERVLGKTRENTRDTSPEPRETIRDMSPEQISNLTLDELAEGVVKDLLGGQRIVKDVTREVLPGDGGIRYMASASDGRTMGQRADAQFNETLLKLTPENADKTVLTLGKPSDVMRSTGIEDKDVKLYGNKIIKKMRDHGFALSDLRNLPSAIRNPIAIFSDDGTGGTHRILTELKTNRGNVLVSIGIGKGNDTDFNIIHSAFGKGNDRVVRWINDGKLLYANKERALSYLRIPSQLQGATDIQGLENAVEAVKNFANPRLPITNIPPATPDVNSNIKISENISPTAPKGAENEVFMPSMPSDRATKQVLLSTMQIEVEATAALSLSDKAFPILPHYSETLGWERDKLQAASDDLLANIAAARLEIAAGDISDAAFDDLRNQMAEFTMADEAYIDRYLDEQRLGGIFTDVRVAITDDQILMSSPSEKKVFFNLEAYKPMNTDRLLERYEAIKSDRDFVKEKLGVDFFVPERYGEKITAAGNDYRKTVTDMNSVFRQAGTDIMQTKRLVEAFGLREHSFAFDPNYTKLSKLSQEYSDLQASAPIRTLEKINIRLGFMEKELGTMVDKHLGSELESVDELVDLLRIRHDVTPTTAVQKQIENIVKCERATLPECYEMLVRGKNDVSREWQVSAEAPDCAVFTSVRGNSTAPRPYDDIVRSPQDGNYVVTKNAKNPNAYDVHMIDGKNRIMVVREQERGLNQIQKCVERLVADKAFAATLADFSDKYIQNKIQASPNKGAEKPAPRPGGIDI